MLVRRGWMCVLPSNQIWSVENNDEGHRVLTEQLRILKIELAVCEATGGFETLMASTLMLNGIPMSIVNARQVRNFAKALGILAKTDAIDAKVLAQFAQMVRPRITDTLSHEQQALEALMNRRRQLVDMLTMEKIVSHLHTTVSNQPLKNMFAGCKNKLKMPIIIYEKISKKVLRGRFLSIYWRVSKASVS